jgi:hypothetical protein
MKWLTFKVITVAQININKYIKIRFSIFVLIHVLIQLGISKIANKRNFMLELKQQVNFVIFGK